MRSKELIRLLEKNGWKLVSGGRHAHVRKGNYEIPIPIHNKEIPNGTLNNILKLAGLK